MAACARSHGGDGGGRPPHGRPTRLLHGCESSQPKKVRGRGSNKNLIALYNSRGKKKIPLELDPNGTYRFVGFHGGLFIRCISSEMWKVPLYFEGWENLEDEDKARVYHTIDYYFDLESWIETEEWGKGISAGIDDDCARRYKDHKAELKRHFDVVGGYDDVETAREHPHKYVTPEAWNDVINKLFLNEKYKLCSERNKANRNKQPYPSRSGSRSLASWRHMENQAIGRTRLIDMWREMHFHPVNGWVTKKAEQIWGRIEQERARMQKEAGDAPIDEEECLRRVLGERSGWNRGVGRKVRNLRPGVPFKSPSQAQYDELNEKYSKLNEHVLHLTAELKSMKKRRLSSQARDEDEDEDEDEQ